MDSSDEMMLLPDYEAVVERLKFMGITINAAELHGLICGFICAGKDNEAQKYLESLESSNEGGHKGDRVISDLYRRSTQQMASMSFGFQLLLPSEEMPLSVRACCLGEWCEGFKKGFALAGLSIEQITEQESKDALFHISEVANIDHDEIEVGDEDESCLIEVCEYIRMAVLMIYTERRLSPAAYPPRSKEIH